MGQRRRFAREFKLEAVKLVRDRDVSVAQVSRDQGVHETCCANGSRSSRLTPACVS